MKRLTANERYLLDIIARMRGNAYDMWGRLNALATRKETIARAAPLTEVAALLTPLQTQEGGAHLPSTNDPWLTSEQKHYLIGAHARSAQKGRTITHVNQLLPKRTRRRKDKKA